VTQTQEAFLLTAIITILAILTTRQAKGGVFTFAYHMISFYILTIIIMIILSVYGII